MMHIIKAMGIVNKIKQTGVDDPRRIIHSIKVGLALTLVSLLFYFRPLYDGFGQAGMWAILTVVVVSEFTVGGTLSRSINRGVATLVAGALGVGVEYFASLSGETGEPIILGLLVFLLAAGSTFVRFFPNVKRKYDYGVLIFILTFSLVAVSGVRVAQILELAHQRLSTILIGGTTCIMVSLFICPVWAGHDLHHLIARNIANLAAFFQGFGNEFDDSISPPNDEIENEETGGRDDMMRSYQHGHKSVFNSKSTEEALANFAWWEPRHGHFKFNHPWKHYLKIGCALRECAYKIEALCICINNHNNNNKAKPQATKSEFHPCFVKISREASHALKHLAASVKDMTRPTVQDFRTSATALKTTLENSSLSENANIHEIMALLAVASLLLDIIDSVENISTLVHQLAQKAGFRTPDSPAKVVVQQPVPVDHVVIQVVGEEINEDAITDKQQLPVL